MSPSTATCTPAWPGAAPGCPAVSDAEVAALILDPDRDVFVLYLGGAPAGFFELDRRAARRGAPHPPRAAARVPGAPPGQVVPGPGGGGRLGLPAGAGVDQRRRRRRPAGHPPLPVGGFRPLRDHPGGRARRGAALRAHIE